MLVQHILKLTNILCLTPLRPNCVLNKSCAVFLLCVYGIGLVLKNMKILEYYKHPWNMLTIYNIVITASIHISGILYVFSICTTTIFLYPYGIQTITNHLKQFDKETNFKEKPKGFWILYVFFIVICPLFYFQIIVAFSLSRNFTWTRAKYYFVSYFIRHIMSVCIFLHSWLLIEVFLRFRYLNKLLKGAMAFECNFSFAIRPERKIKFLSRQFDILFDTSIRINKYFGVSCVFFLINCILELLGHLTHIVYEFIHYTVYRKDARALQFILGLAMTLTLTLLGMSGHYLCKEIQKTVKICYDQINEMHKTYRYDAFKNQLKFLAEQVSQRNLDITAAGFISINRPLLGAMLSSINTYIIVILQIVYVEKDDKKYAND